MKKHATPAKGTPDKDLERQAKSQLDARKYKEAIELYKKVLHVNDTPENRQQLAHCYLQRALTFAEKGMPKEALVLWENHCQHTQPPYHAYDQYLIWLIQSKNTSKLVTSLGQLTPHQLDKQYPTLATVLGFLLLTDRPELAAALPQDTQFIAHAKHVQSALTAFQANDLDKVEAALKQLPYRSAFRDVRTLLSALLLLPSAVEQAKTLLTKIPAHSPYAVTANLLLACMQDGAALVHTLTTFTHAQRSSISDLKKLSNAQRDVIEQLARQQGALTDKVKLNLAIEYQTLFGTALAQQLCQSLLPNYPAGQKAFNKAFAATSVFEEHRLRALTYEQDRNTYDAHYHWRQCITALQQTKPVEHLKIALILRHSAEKTRSAEDSVDLLIESLDHDPDDCATYLQLLNLYSQNPDATKHYKQWLKTALEKFPHDSNVLTLAIQAASRSKAYKKASQYAQTLLKTDPLNTFAKQTLFRSHLAHARRLLQTKKFQLVDAELQRAERYIAGKKDSLTIQLLRGFFCYAHQDKIQGLQDIATLLNKRYADPVNAHFQASMEALLTGLPVASILRALPPAKDHVLSAQELTHLIEQLQDYTQTTDTLEPITKALDKIKPALKKSVQQQPYEEALLLNLCQTLDPLQHFELLRVCSKLAQAKWQKPIWMYYKIYAETNNDPEHCTYINQLRLQSSLEQARHEKDHRATVLISNYLDRYFSKHPQKGFNFLDELLGGYAPEEVEDPFDRLFSHLPDEIFYKLNKKITQLVKKITPERLIKDLGKTLSSADNIMFAMMKDPDLFTALMIVKAAADEDINIGVSAQDVLDCFGVGKKSSAFPF